MDTNDDTNLQGAQGGPGDSQDGNHAGPSPAVASSESVEVEGLNLNEIPENVRPIVVDRLKAMRADHTRKTQEASERMKEAETLRQKAALADLLLANPQVANLVNGRASAGNGNGAHDEDAEDEERISKLNDDAKAGVEAMLRRFRKRELGPAYDPLIRRFQAFEQKEIKREWETVKKELPEVEKRQDKVMAYLADHPDVADLRQAVLASVGAEIAEERLEKAKKADLTSRQNAQLQRPGTPAKETQSSAKPKYTHLRDALAAVLAAKGKS